MGPGATTMDILREWFGEASFQDAPSWQPWAPGGDQPDGWQSTGGPGHGPGSGIDLACPKFQTKLGTATGEPRGENRATRAPTLALGEAIRGTDQGPSRQSREVEQGRCSAIKL